MSYLRLIGQRLVMLVLTLWGLATLVFFMVKLIPGDEAQIAAGPGASPAQVAAVAARLGLDAPIHEQYVRFIARLLRGDLGASILSSQPVLNDLMKVLPCTIELMAASAVIGTVLAFSAALCANMRPGGVIDSLTRIGAIVGGGLPTFWLALMMQYLLGTVWRIAPISGHNAFGMAAPTVTGMPTIDAVIAGNPAAFANALRYLALPAVVLAVSFAGQAFRVLRASLLAALASEMVPPVRAKGASHARILVRHALPNSLVPTINVLGTLIGGMMGGVILVETVFARRGVGTYLANAVAQKDTFAVLGTVMFIGAFVCLVNLIADIAELVVDPRLRTTAFGGHA
ncbi:MAG: ABC transporter permease [Candidatus Kaistia colombiensis]|nr:MAG: ABC transporter permease [Kaistia sp.]